MKVISLLFLVIACASHQVVSHDITEGQMGLVEDVRVCYVESDTFMENKELLVDAQYLIMPDGSTKEHEIVYQSLKDPNFSACFLSKMKTLKFLVPVTGAVPGDNKALDIPVKGTLIKQPFRFLPKKPNG